MISIENNEPSANNEPSSAATGNASNPDPKPDDIAPSTDNQLLGKGAEKYLREVASIEDIPDARDQQEMDKVLKENKNEKDSN